MKTIELTCKQNNIRINKFLAENKICSRRQADKMIGTNRVMINLYRKKNDIYVKAILGDLLSENDKVKVEYEDNSYYIYNKARNEVSPSFLINKNIKLVFTLPKEYSGIILYSDDSNLSQKIKDRDNISYEYTIRTKENISQLSIGRLLSGVTHEGVQYKKVIKAKILDEACHTLLLVMAEYKENIISRILDAVRLNVESVHRTRIGNISVSGMEVNTYKTLNIDDLIFM